MRLKILTFIIFLCKFNIFTTRETDSADSYDFLPCVSQIYQNFLKDNGRLRNELIIIASQNEMVGMNGNGKSILQPIPSGDGRPTFQIEFYDRNMTMTNSWVDQLLAKIYSNNNCFEDSVFILLEKLAEVLMLVEKIGISEGSRISPVNFRLSCTPKFFIMWDRSSEIQFKEEHNQTSHLPLPGLASQVYFVLLGKTGEHADDKRETLNCSIFEYYTFRSSAAMAASTTINHVLPNGIGNFMETRTNLHGYTMRAGGVGQRNRSGNEFSDDSIGFGYVGTNLVGAGISEQVLSCLQQSFGFEVQIITKSSWIEVPTNGTWTGLGKLLTDGSIDISIDQAIYVPVRAKYFTLLVPSYDKRSMNVYFRQPPASSVRNVFILPFSIGVWIVAFGIFILGLALFALLSRLIGTFPKHFNLSIKNEVEQFANNYALWLISFFTNQGWFQEPKQTFLRIIFLVGSLMGLILYTAYTANLVSVFTSQEKPIKNIDDFVGSNLAVYGAGSSPVAQLVFNGSLRGSSGSLDQPVKSIQYFYDLPEILQGLLNRYPSGSTQSYGVLWISYWFFSQIRFNFPNVTDSCLCYELSEIPTMFSAFKAGLILPKNSPFEEPFNNKIMNLHESGILRRDQKALDDSYKPTCDKNLMGRKFFNSAADELGLSIADTWTAFLILIAGSCIPLATLLCELSWGKLKQFVIDLK